MRRAPSASGTRAPRPGAPPRPRPSRRAPRPSAPRARRARGLEPRAAAARRRDRAAPMPPRVRRRALRREPLPCGQHAPAHRGGRLRRRRASSSRPRPRHRDDEVEAVEQRAGQLLAVRGQPLRRSTRTRPRDRRARRTGTGSSSRRAGSARGRARCPPTRATETKPSSSGWRSASSAGRWNSGSSSSSRTPRCARLASPGRGLAHRRRSRPSRRRGAARETAARATSGRSGESRPATEWIRVTSSASSRRQRRQDRRAAAARASSCPFPAGRRAAGCAPRRPRARAPAAPAPGRARRRGRAASALELARAGGSTRRRPQLAAQVGDRLGEVTHRNGVDARRAPPRPRTRRRRACRSNPAAARPPRPRARPRPDGPARRARARRRAACSRSRSGGSWREAGEEREARSARSKPEPSLRSAGGREVDRDPPRRWPLELADDDAAPHAMLRLLAGAVGEPDDREAGSPPIGDAPRPRRGAARDRRRREVTARASTPRTLRRDEAVRRCPCRLCSPIRAVIRRRGDQDRLEVLAGAPARAAVDVPLETVVEPQTRPAQDLGVEIAAVVDDDADRARRVEDDARVRRAPSRCRRRTPRSRPGSCPRAGGPSSRSRRSSSPSSS